MRAAAILGLGCSRKDLKPFQADVKEPSAKVEWRMGMPAPGEADVVLLFGGDGTVHRHLGQLVRLGLPVLVVPAGSGNDFARALGLRRVRDSLQAWQEFCGGAGNVRAIDLGIIIAGGRAENNDFSSDGQDTPTFSETGEKWGTQSVADASGARSKATALYPGQTYFCCVAGVGLDSEVSRRANRLPRWLRGHGGYALTLAPTIVSFAPFPLKILIPNEEATQGSWTIRSDQPTILAAFANAPVYGGGMKIAPQAQMDDGLLDVCVVGGVDPFKLFCMFPTVYYGRHLKIREVTYFSAGRVRVETEQPLDVYADGEYVCRTPVEIGVQSGALQVIVP